MGLYAKKNKKILVMDCEYLSKERDNLSKEARDLRSEVAKLNSEAARQRALLQFQQNTITQLLSIIKIG